MADLQEYKCPCCGGSIAFDSESQQMKCPYCETIFEMETLISYDEDLKNEHESELKWDVQSNNEWQTGEQEGMLVYSCQSCGGEIICDENTAATKCPYCDNNVVMKGQFSGSMRPDIVIPFSVNKDAAKKLLNKHFKGKHFLPKVFSSENHIEEIKGIYVPFWLFDADADASVRYNATKVKTWSDSKYRYKSIEYYSIIREGSVGFNHIPVDGSSKMSDDLMESIEPYELKDAKDFQTAYLAGYLADKYDVTVEQSIGRANERVKKSTEGFFANTVKNYATVTVEHSNINLSNGKTKYAMYPVWILTTKWAGQTFTFAINGQTGKFVGNLPIDKGAYWRWFAALTVVFAGLAFGLQYLMLL